VIEGMHARSGPTSYLQVGLKMRLDRVMWLPASAEIWG
jgi:hypothetical protein